MVMRMSVVLHIIKGSEPSSCAANFRLATIEERIGSVTGRPGIPLPDCALNGGR